jgi:hypothetical protein
MRKLFNYLFNEDLGCFVRPTFYEFEGKTYVGYVLCRGYRFFGIYGVERISHCYDIDDLYETIQRLKVSVSVSL